MYKQEIPLREKKYASLKLKILDLFDEKLKKKNLEEISVKEIVNELNISEMTFFNYFGSKKEVLIYFIELWSLEMQLLIENKKPVDAIYLIFKNTANMIKKNHNLFMEIVSAMALYGVAKKDITITKAERILRFGTNIPYKEGGFRELMLPILKKLQLSEEKCNSLYIALFNTCFATPLLIKSPKFKDLETIYNKQLNKILKDIDNV